MMKLTKSTIDKLPTPTVPDSGKPCQKRYYDETLTGFGLRVTSGGAKTFFAEKRVQGKSRRISIGRYPAMTVQQARQEAQGYLSDMMRGIDPVAHKRAQDARSKTLLEVYRAYEQQRPLAASTQRNYGYVLSQYFKDWQDKPLIHITKDDVLQRHRLIGERSPARANLAMRLLRALFNFARGEFEDEQGNPLIGENPVDRLSHTRSWFRIERRQTVIKRHGLAPWFDGIRWLETDNKPYTHTVCDYLKMVLLTGLRRNEAATLTWDTVDLQAGTLTVLKTKNHRPHTLPLSDYLWELLKRRHATSQSPYVFPSRNSTERPLLDLTKTMQKMITHSGVDFTLHDLRRTFITIAESLDISAFALKQLLNHASMTQDVTAGYIIMDAERLRKPMQRITDAILEYGKVQPETSTATMT